MDFNKLKVYGFPRHLTQYKIFYPRKIRYLESKQFGYFEAPKYSKNQELRYLVEQYKQKQEYEKYMNPKGYKFTWSSRYPKTGETIDYADIKCFLVRSGKSYDQENLVKFFVEKNLSKFEIKQFIEKLYRIKVNRINTAILPGKVKFDPMKRRYIRTNDVKKALVEVDFPVDRSFREIDELRKIK